jgi:short-subunit dehydrogenase
MERLLTLNILSLTSLSILFADQMKKRGSGRILNVGSFAGNQATPLFAPYAASKRYVHDFSLALRNELKSRGVSVTCLVPGFVSTDFDANAGIANSRYLSLSSAGSLTPAQVAKIGLKAMFSGRGRVTAGLFNKIGAALASPVPAKVKAAIIYRAVHRIVGE